MPTTAGRAVPRRRARAAPGAAVVVATALLTACAPVAAAPPQDGRPVVLTTFTVLANMAAVVAGPDARVESITDVGAEIHGYEPSPDDLRRAAEADLLLANGLGLEVWLEALVAPLDLPTVVLSDGIDALPIRTDRGGGSHSNPHAWMSPELGAHYVGAVADALADLDPAHAQGYAARAARYAERITAVGDELAAALADVPPEHRVLVTCEGAFAYLARDAGLEEAYLWPVNAERQGTPRQVARVVRTVLAAQVPAVFCESTVSPTAQRQVARETGARFGGTLYVDSLSGPDGPVPTYLDLLEHDVALITSGLGGQRDG